MKTLYEIQASFVGIGKSTFAQKFQLPFADDCVHLVDSLCDYWYTGNRYFLSIDSNTEALFKAYLVLENSACTVFNALSKSHENNIISARSALVSAVQFLPFQPSLREIEALVDFYQARLKQMGVEKVVVFDFGSSILLNDKHIESGYERMCERARPYELTFFNSFEKYKDFFEAAEQKKHSMIEELMKRSHFFQIKQLDYNDFGFDNYCQVLYVIRGGQLSLGQIKMESDSCWHVKDLGILQRVISPLIIDFEPEGVFPTWQVARDQHCRSNRHHVEFFEWLGSMTELDKREMLCDILSCFLTGQWKRGNTSWKIGEAANYCRRSQNWEIVRWIYDGEYRLTNNVIKPRWPSNKFDHEKEWLILWVQALLTGRITKETFTDGLYGFDSVHYYIQDLLWHQAIVVEMAKRLFPSDEDLTQRCDVHDYDKWDSFMVAAYTLKKIFEVEIVPLAKISEADENILNFILLRIEEQESKLTKPIMPEV